MGDNADEIPIISGETPQSITLINVTNDVVTKTYGDTDFTLGVTSTSTEPITYTSSDPNVVTVNADGLVTILSTGTATITASQGETAAFTAATISINITVNKVVATLNIPNTTIIKVVTDAPFSIGATSNSDVPITYTSSDHNIATVNTDGIVTIVSAGNAIITLSQIENNIYLPSSILVELIIFSSKQVTVLNAPNKNIQKTYGDTDFTLGVTSTSTEPITYTSSDPSVAVVNSTGNVTILSAGTATITTSQVETAEFTAATISINITVNKVGTVLNASDMYISKLITDIDTPFSIGVTSNSNAPITYSSSNKFIRPENTNSNIVTVNADGIVTIVGLGIAIITVSQAETSAFTAATINIEIFVTKVQTVLNVPYNIITKAQTDEPFRIEVTSNSDAPMIYTSLYPNVATVDSNGLVMLVSPGNAIITLSQIETNIYTAASTDVEVIIFPDQPVTTVLNAPSTFILKTYGDPDFTLGVTSNSNGTITYTSSNINVATVNSSGNVSIVNSGTVVISVSQTGNEYYSSASFTITMDIIPKTTALTVPNINIVKNTHDDIFNLNITSNNSTESIIYTSSNSNVATVNNIGNVYIHSQGTATITASQASNLNFTSASVSISLTVNPRPKQTSSIWFLNNKTTYYVHRGDEVFDLFQYFIPQGSIENITYTTSDANVATVNNIGELTLLSLGTTIIRISAPETEEYYSAYKDVTIHVVNKIMPDLTTSYIYNTYVGAPLFYLNPETNTDDTLIEYESLNPDMVVVDSWTVGGAVYVQDKTGTAIVKIILHETNNYLAYTGEVTINIRDTNNARGQFIYRFNNTDDIIFNESHIPIITTFGSIYYGYTLEVINELTKETRVTVNWSMAGSFNNILGEDGLSFGNKMYIDNKGVYVEIYNMYRYLNITIEKFDNIPLSSSGKHFYQLNNFTIEATDSPTIYKTLNSCFYECINFNSPISNWNTSTVTDMGHMFYHARKFNQPVNHFNTSNVTSMYSMFAEANEFNQGVSSFDTRKVTNMSYMFYTAMTFNQPLLNFNTDNVVDIEQMFHNAIVFNQPLAHFNVSKVKSLIEMFSGAQSFNQPLNSWNVSKVEFMDNTFYKAFNFNQPLNSWNIENIKSMTNMFSNAYAFNQNLSSWIFTKKIPITDIFKKAYMFNNGYDNTDDSHPLGDGWNVFANYTGTFRENSVLSNGNAFPLISLIQSNPKPLLIGQTSYTKSMSDNTFLLYLSSNSSNSISYINLDVNNKVVKISNTGMVTITGEGIANVVVYQPETTQYSSVSKLITINVLNKNSIITRGQFIYRFNNTDDIIFNESHIPIITISNSMTYTYTLDVINELTKETRVTVNWSIAGSFNDILENDGLSFGNKMYIDNTGAYSEIYNMYRYLNITIEKFDNIPLSASGKHFYHLNKLTIEATDSPTIYNTLNSCFYECINFNSPISNWNTSNVTDMKQMFYRARKFNQPVNHFNTSNVTSMYSMFSEANDFNQPLLNFNIDNVVDIEQMFHNAIAFNQPLAHFNISKLVLLSGMFNGAQSFNQPLNSWNVSNVKNMSNMFCNAFNFNQPLNSWNVSKVVSVDNMFCNAYMFNQNLSSWTFITRNSLGIKDIFSGAYMFNNGYDSTDNSHPLGDGWNVFANYNDTFRENSVLSAGNAYPLIQNQVAKLPTNLQVVTSFNKHISNAAFNLNATSNSDSEIMYININNRRIDPDYYINDKVISVNNNGNVNILNVGVSNVIVFQKSTNAYSAAVKLVTVTIFPDPIEATINVESQIVKTFLDPDFNLNVTSTNPSSINYTSDNLNIAIVSSSGVVTIRGAGICNITLTQSESMIYMAISKTIKLVVNKYQSALSTLTPTIEIPFSLVPYNINNINISGGKVGLIYTVDNNSIADINTSELVLKRTGSAIITVIQPETVNVLSSSIAINLIIRKASPIISGSSSITKMLEEADFNLNLQSTNNAQIRYSLSRQNIISINDLGFVSKLRGGSVVINASTLEDDNWTSATKSISVRINVSPINKARGIFIYRFNNTNNVIFNESHIPIITTNETISYTFTTQLLNILTKETRVTVNWEINGNLNNIEGNDGLSFGNKMYIDNTGAYSEIYNMYRYLNITIEKFDNIPLSASGKHFYQLNNLTIEATDSPTIYNTLNSCFYECYIFNSPISNWNTSNVTDMKQMFYRARKFNQPVNHFNTSNVTSMHLMFAEANEFNQSVSSFDTRKVTNMSYMFDTAMAFNQPLLNFNTDNVVDIEQMFNNAIVFNQPLAHFNISKIVSLEEVFSGAKRFNQPLNSWNVSNVTNMIKVFCNAFNFNQPLNSWNVSNVNNTEGMFCNAYMFNQNLSSWNFTKRNSLGIKDIFSGALMFNNGYDNTDNSHPLGDGWNVFANYNNTFRENSILSNGNAYPLVQNQVSKFPTFLRVSNNFNKSIADTLFNLNATSNNTSSILYYSQDLFEEVLIVSKTGLVTIKGPGTAKIILYQKPTATHSADVQLVTINVRGPKTDAIINVVNPVGVTIDSEPFKLDVTSNNSDPIYYNSLTPNIVSIRDDGYIIVNDIGEATIELKQLDNDDFLETSLTITFRVNLSTLKIGWTIIHPNEYLFEYKPATQSWNLINNYNTTAYDKFKALLAVLGSLTPGGQPLTFMGQPLKIIPFMNRKNGTISYDSDVYDTLLRPQTVVRTSFITINSDGYLVPVTSGRTKSLTLTFNTNYSEDNISSARILSFLDIIVNPGEAVITINNNNITSTSNNTSLKRIVVNPLSFPYYVNIDSTNTRDKIELKGNNIVKYIEMDTNGKLKIKAPTEVINRGNPNEYNQPISMSISQTPIDYPYGNYKKLDYTVFLEIGRLQPVLSIDSNSTTLQFPGGVKQIIATSNSDGLIVYRSLNPNVATVSVNGLVTPVNVGTTKILVSQKSSANYLEFSENNQVYLDVSVIKGPTSVKYSVRYTKNITDAAFNLNVTSNNNSTLSYVSTNESIVSVNTSGLVTIKGAGECNIVVSQQETTKLLARTVSINIVVNKIQGKLTLNKQFTKTFGDSSFNLGVKSNSPGAILYNVVGTSINVNTEGNINILSGGTSTINVVQNATSIYTASSDTITVIINKKQNKITAPKTLNMTYENKSLPLLVKSVSDAPITYTSTNPNVALINNLGVVSIVGSGSTTINISQPETLKFLSSSASTTITISKATSIVNALKSTSKFCGDAPFGLNFSSNSDGIIEYTSTNANVAYITNDKLVGINNAGTAVIQIRQTETNKYKSVIVNIPITVSKLTPFVNVPIPLNISLKNPIYNLNIDTNSNATRSYRSTNSNIVIVDQTGKLVARKLGTTIIQVTIASNEKYNLVRKDIVVTVTL